MRIDGSQLDTTLIVAGNPVAIAAGSGYLFWADADGSIGRARADGTAVTEGCIVPAGGAADSIAVLGPHVYWTSGRVIGRAALDGSALDRHFLRPGGLPSAIAADTLEIAAGGSSGPCRQPASRALLGWQRSKPGPLAEGWGKVAPSIVDDGVATETRRIDGIRWRGWGAVVASGRGSTDVFGGAAPRSGPAAIDLRASRLARCEPEGPLVYTHLSARRHLTAHGAPGPWFTWADDLCAPGPEPAVAPPSGSGPTILAVQPLPAGDSLDIAAENVVVATVDLGFAVTVANRSDAPLENVKAVVTIGQRPELVCSQTVARLAPGEMRQIVARPCHPVQFAMRLALSVIAEGRREGARPGAPSARSTARYSVTFSLA